MPPRCIRPCMSSEIFCKIIQNNSTFVRPIYKRLEDDRVQGRKLSLTHNDARTFSFVISCFLAPFLFYCFMMKKPIILIMLLAMTHQQKTAFLPIWDGETSISSKPKNDRHPWKVVRELHQILRCTVFTLLLFFARKVPGCMIQSD